MFVFSTFYGPASNANSGDAPEALNDYGPSNINAQDPWGRCLILCKMKA